VTEGGGGRGSWRVTTIVCSVELSRTERYDVTTVIIFVTFFDPRVILRLIRFNLSVNGLQGEGYDFVEAFSSFSWVLARSLAMIALI